MLRRLPQRLLWRQARCLQTLSTVAPAPESGLVGVTSSPGVGHEAEAPAGGGRSSRTWQIWPAVVGVAAAAAAWHAHGGSIALADAARPDKVCVHARLTWQCACMQSCADQVLRACNAMYNQLVQCHVQPIGRLLQLVSFVHCPVVTSCPGGSLNFPRRIG